jgi:hypothetical protein
MTDIRQDSAEADEDSFLNSYFDRALKLREMESAKAGGRVLHGSGPGRRRTSTASRS